MWVLTDEGRIVNLDQTFEVFVDAMYEPGKQVLAYSPAVATYQGHDRYVYTTLCACDDEAHGKRIIATLFELSIKGGSTWVDMRAIKEATQGVKRNGD